MFDSTLGRSRKDGTSLLVESGHHRCADSQGLLCSRRGHLAGAESYCWIHPQKACKKLTVPKGAQSMLGGWHEARD